jgi:hypothetical protein
MKAIEIVITETGRNSLKESPTTFNQEIRLFDSVEDVKAYLIERYGRIPKGRKKVFIGDGIEVGFIHSYWNKDYSHDSKPWFQTDWITFSEVVKTPVLI